MEEDMQRARKVSQQIDARNTRLQTQVRQFWTEAYTAFDKGHARKLLRAGYDDPEYRAGVYLDEQRETEKGDDYD
jgi:hypothetical protein